MALPLLLIGVVRGVAYVAGTAAVITFFDRFKAPDQVENNNFPAQPEADTINFNTGDTAVTDNTALYIAGAVTLYGLYQWSKKA